MPEVRQSFPSDYMSANFIFSAVFCTTESNMTERIRVYDRLIVYNHRQLVAE